MAAHTHPTLLLAPDYSVRHYDGEVQSHSHGHVQLLYALAGRMELEVDGKQAYVDTASGLVIPAGASHAYLAQQGSAIAVVDVPEGSGLSHLRRFSAPAPDWLATHASAATMADAHLAWVQQSPVLLQRRVLDVQAITTSQALAAGQPLETTALHCGYSSASALAYALRRDRGVGSRALRQQAHGG